MLSGGIESLVVPISFDQVSDELLVTLPVTALRLLPGFSDLPHHGAAVSPRSEEDPDVALIVI